MREGVADHQMVDVLMRDAGLGEGRGAGDAERARGGEILHLADHRSLDTLAGAEEVERLCGKSLARSATTRIKAVAATGKVRKGAGRAVQNAKLSDREGSV
jgi:hypothetical protein